MQQLGNNEDVDQKNDQRQIGHRHHELDFVKTLMSDNRKVIAKPIV